LASVAQGRRTRQEILQVAMDLASTDGLEGLTIGGLAERLGLSKGGLFRHFGSKDELQVATIGAAAERFGAVVVKPAQTAAPGLARLRALMRGYLDYLEQPVFPGGCFFAAASSELDGRPGAPRDRLVEILGGWRGLLLEQAAIAARTGELPGADPQRLVFRLLAYALEANWTGQLFADARAYDHAREAIAEALTPGSQPATMP
jgi:AcrR family transcriptional regulator